MSFFVPGEPKTAGSKVSGVAHRRLADGTYEPVRAESGKLRTFTKDDTGEAGKAWRADVREAAQVAMLGRAPLEGELTLAATFYRRRAKGHYGTGRNAYQLKLNAPAFPSTKPDATKYVRALEDALKGIVWLDDAQVVALFAGKRYATDGRIGAAVRIERAVPGVEYGLAVEVCQPRLTA